MPRLGGDAERHEQQRGGRQPRGRRQPTLVEERAGDRDERNICGLEEPKLRLGPEHAQGGSPQDEQQVNQVP